MSSPVKIPCMCNNGRPCGKVLEISEHSKGYYLDVKGTGNHIGMVVDDAGRRELITALGGSP